jgi:uncharacterized protein (DUF2267 family)
MNYNEMMRTVAGRTGLTRRGADQAVLGTLTVLAESVSAKETKDLLAQLPKSLRERVPVSEEALEMRPIEFVARVADLNENPSLETTEAHVRAVFATLNEAVNRGEMNDIAEELGEDFTDLMGRPAHAPGPPAEEAERAVVDAAMPLPEPATTERQDAHVTPGVQAAPDGESLPAVLVSAAVHATAAVPRAVLALARLPFAAAARLRPSGGR